MDTYVRKVFVGIIVLATLGAAGCDLQAQFSPRSSTVPRMISPADGN